VAFHFLFLANPSHRHVSPFVALDAVCPLDAPAKRDLPGGAGLVSSVQPGAGRGVPSREIRITLRGMPALRRHDGVDIHWDEHGDGPPVLLLHHCFSHPAVYAGLCRELARDHRVITYDARGTGQSTRRGPYHLRVDVRDLEALVSELGGGVVAVGLGDGRDRAIRVANSRPDLIPVVVGCDATPMGRASGDIEAPSASRGVLEAVVSLAASNQRAAVRSVLEFTNPDMSDDELRRRLDAEVAYSSPEALQARSEWFIRWDSVEAARAVGARLWIAYWDNDWTPGDAAAKIHELLPDARVYPIAEGPISRPELTAGVVRKVTAGAVDSPHRSMGKER
jgi:pimeloyl-ACP methyl ester carboxylesterase